VEELRQVINELRPPSVIRLGLAKAIRLQADDIQERAPQVQWGYRLAEDDNLLSASVCLALFRIYQEAVNNIVRHSEATKARISFRLRDDKIVLEIKDNGKGLPLKRDFDSLTLNDHFGLAGMSERAEAIGGKLEILSTPGCGTKLRVVAPFRREDQANLEQVPG
jgi:signal transduction histidine kinase